MDEKQFPSSDQVCREIRFGRLSRDQGIQIVRYYENQRPSHIDLFCAWLGVDERSLLFAANRHRNKKYWDEIEPNVWVKREKSFTPSEFPPKHSKLEYPLGSFEINGEDAHGYVTVGKGVNWPSRPVISDNNNWI